MAKITLKPLDDGQRPVEIPVGKTTIGRGPFLGCSDKKVSRNHAVLEVTNKGEVFLTPTHVNPCFYQPTADSPGQILKKDIPHKLENGDTFSLLPRAFRYQLIVVGDKDQDKIDQKELNKGKTNGSTAKCDAILNERNKDPKKGISNEELNDGSTVTEKPFLKEDHILTNTDKNCTKEENSLAKKIAPDEDSKSPSTKMSNEDSEKEKPETNSISKKDEKLESDKVSSDKNDCKDDSQDNDDLCAEDKVEYEKTKFSEKILEENESTLGNDTFAKDKTDIVQSSEKIESNEKSKNKKTDVSARNGDDNMDSNLDLQYQVMTTKMDISIAQMEAGDSNQRIREASLEISEINEKSKSEIITGDEDVSQLNQTSENTILNASHTENEIQDIGNNSITEKSNQNKNNMFELDYNMEEICDKNKIDMNLVDSNIKTNDTENSLCESEQDMGKGYWKNSNAILENGIGETVLQMKNADTVKLNIKLPSRNMDEAGEKENSSCEASQDDEEAYITRDISSDEDVEASVNETALSHSAGMWCESGHSVENIAHEIVDHDEWDFQQEIQDIINEESDKVCQSERGNNNEEFTCQTEKEIENENSWKPYQEHKIVIEAKESPEKNPCFTADTHESDQNTDKAEILKEETTKEANNLLIGEHSLGNQADETDEENVLPDMQITDEFHNQVCNEDAREEISHHLVATSRFLKSRSRKRRYSEEVEDVKLQELVEVNKRIEENLLEIGKEVKKRNILQEEANKLQEEVIRLKQKKIKLMYLAANVKDELK